jgi:hypothetical protein
MAQIGNLETEKGGGAPKASFMWGRGDRNSTLAAMHKKK